MSKPNESTPSSGRLTRSDTEENKQEALDRIQNKLHDNLEEMPPGNSHGENSSRLPPEHSKHRESSPNLSVRESSPHLSGRESSPHPSGRESSPKPSGEQAREKVQQKIDGIRQRWFSDSDKQPTGKHKETTPPPTHGNADEVFQSPQNQVNTSVAMIVSAT